MSTSKIEEENGKKNSNNKKKKVTKQKNEKKPKTNTSTLQSSVTNNPSTTSTHISKSTEHPLNRGSQFHDEYENDKEIEEFKKKLQLDSIHAKEINKIKPLISKDWLKDM